MDRTTIERIDDIDQESAADERIRFALDGRAYVIDLTAERAKDLRARLAPYVERARPDRAPSSPSARSRGTSSTAERQERERIRAWARSQGLDVSERGRIPASVRAQYAASH